MSLRTIGPGVLRTMSDVQIQLLGAVEVRRRGCAVPLAGRRLRTLLAVLALAADGTVAAGSLVQALWDDDPPERARGSLQTTVSRLRRVIGDDVVQTTAGGYRLRVRREDVDVLRFRDAVAAASAETDPQQEREQLATALALWAGDPFGEPLSDWLERHDAPRLIEEHLAARERRIDLDLAADRAEDVVQELLTLTERYPMRESLWARLVRALRAAGRAAEALRTYEMVRAMLAEELGADPGQELQQLHHELLTTPRSEVPGTTVRCPPVRQLPRPPAQFVGRLTELERLDWHLQAHDHTGPLILHGPGGVGKTALALRWSDAVADQFPDGQLFVDLHGFDEHAVEPIAALETLLRSLGVSGEDIPAREPDATSLLRSLLAERHYLLVLDNARDAAQVRPLLPGGRSVVLVTSRSQMRSLAAHEGAHRIAVDVLPDPDAVAMLATRSERSASRCSELAELADLCGHLPVALAVIAERAGRESGALADLVARLRDEAGRLDELTTGDDPLTDVRAAFDGSYAQLDHDTARLFRLLGLHPETSVSVEAAAALQGTDETQARRLLDRLASWHLVGRIGQDWYGMHDLLRMFARDRLMARESEDSRASAQRRLRTWYAHSVFAATYGGEEASLVSLPDLPSGVRPRTFADNAEAMSWLGAHRHVISRLTRTAAADGDGVIASRLVIDFTIYLEYICAEVEERELARIGVAAAQAVGAAANEAGCLNRLGMRLARDDEYDESIACFLRGAERFASIDDVAGEHRLATNAALVHSMAGRAEQAEEILISRVVDLERQGLDDELASALTQLAEVQLDLNRPRDAFATATRATRMLDDDQPRNSAYALDKLAKAALALGDIDGAVSAYDDAAAAFYAVGDVNEAVWTLEELGLAHQEHGRSEAAVRHWSRALELLDEVDNGGEANVQERRQRLASLIADIDRLIS